MEGRKTMAKEVARISAASRFPSPWGEESRSSMTAARLLDSGADRVSVNSAAVRSPAIIGDIAGQFGVQCAVVAIDAAKTARCLGL